MTPFRVRGAGRVLPAAPCRRLLPLLVAFGLLAAAASPADAQLGRLSWELYPHVGALLPGDPGFLIDGVEELDAGVLWGVSWTYHYSDHVGVEIGFSKGTLNGPEDDPATVLGDVGLDFWELNAFVNSGALKPIQFFATAGGGLVNYDPEEGSGPTRLLLDGGVGVRWYKWKNVAIRLEAKDFVFVGAERRDYTGRPDPTFVVPQDGVRPQGAPPPLPGTDPGDDTVHNIGVFAGLSFNF